MECIPLLFKVCGFAIVLWGVLAMRIGNFNIQPEVKSEALVSRGPYQILRNPMYTGILLFFIPAAFIPLSIINSMLYIALVVVLVLKIYREEQLLSSHFGATYKAYKKTTYRLIPLLF
ncbi:methyltransferase family protein [Dokdonia donghaensis]|uniref:methyltransferase family protein n=1 Tax=Dokdonia donghaensis TaxID=326320 RepID=UPI00069081AE|nr:isoprenylcysteine carboxylmethyltransferase family protein [Dokdonia donghaensis]